MTAGPRAEINLEALRHNLRLARKAAHGRRVMAVVKADGYGHGLLRVVRALGDADGFAVARLAEALELRAAGVRAPILVLGGFQDTNELALMSRYGIEACLHQHGQMEHLERLGLDRSVAVWLKVNTGMNRLGFPPQAIPALLQRLNRSVGVRKPVRLMTHLANADNLADPYTHVQLDRFRAVAASFEGECSLANSAGLLGWPQTLGDWCRPGIMLYGCSPLLGRSAADLGLKPAMTLSSRLMAVHWLDADAPIGYGGIWRCPERLRIGVAAVGYGDGYPRAAPTGTPVLVDGHRARLVGRVSMDSMCIDITNLPASDVGSAVVLWGEGLPIEEVASAAGTISYEVLCGITPRVPRITKGTLED